MTIQRGDAFADLKPVAEEGEPIPDPELDAAGRPRLDLSEDQLAIDLGTAWANENARFVAASNSWFVWSKEGKHWRCDETAEAMAETRAYLRRRERALSRWIEAKCSQLAPGEAEGLRRWAKATIGTLRDLRKARNVLAFTQTNPETSARPNDFDADPMVLGVPGQTIDLKSGRAAPARRQDMISRIALVAPEDDPPVVFLEFLDTIFGGDREMIGFLRRALGYSLTADTREHKLFFCYGTGANGKSTFLNILFHILGDYARRAPVSTFLSRANEVHPTDLAGLRGARLVITSEPPRGKTWDEGVVKDVTGGDVISARFMHGDFFDFRPVLKLWIAGNTKPSFRGVDEAMRRRFVLLPFNVTIPPEMRDPELPEKLKAEAGQILGWMIGGCLEWQKVGLKVPASVTAASGQYLDDEDVVGNFLSDETESDASYFVSTTDLHQRFCQWCGTQGLSPWTLRTLQKEVESRGFQTHRRNTGRGFLGLRLKLGGAGEW